MFVKSQIHEIWQDPIEDPLSLLGLAHKHIEWMRIKNYAQATIDNRRYYLCHFLSFSKQLELSMPLEITKEVLEKYLPYLHSLKNIQTGKEISPQGHNGHLGGIKCFFRWMVDKNYILYNFCEDIAYCKTVAKLPRKVLTASEVECIINQTNIATKKGIRDRAILETLYSTGMRRKELSVLTLNDLDLQRGVVIIVQGKGCKDRVVPIGKRACLWIEKYLTEVRAHLPKTSDNLFLSLNGKAIYSPKFITILVSKYVRAAGIKTGSCHIFRHSMATLMLENGADIRYIKDILGHTKLSTTEVYTKVTIDSLKKVHAKSHPSSLESIEEVPSLEQIKPINRGGRLKQDEGNFPLYDDQKVYPDNHLITLAKKFLKWMPINNYSLSYTKSTGYALRTFITYCSNTDVFLAVDVTRQVLENFQSHLLQQKNNKNQPLSSRAKACYLHALTIFFRWLTNNEHIVYNPAARLDMPKCPKRLPAHVLTFEEVEKIFSQPDLTSPLGIRDRAILELFYATAIRRQELVQLTLADIDFERKTLVVSSRKSNKERVVPIGDRAFQWLERYLWDIRPLLLLSPEEQRVFITRNATPVSNDSVNRNVTKYIKAAGITIQGSCHLFRHAAATHMLENGADIRYIKELLGHAELSTTEIYTKVTIGKLKEVHENTHPAKTHPTKTKEIIENIKKISK